MSPSPKSNFKNTDFIDVAPVVRTSKGEGPVTISDQEEMVEVKVEAGTSFEFAANEQIVIASEHLGKQEEYQHAEWESEAASEDGEEAGEGGGEGGVVKLQPRVSSTLCFLLKANICRTRKHCKQNP